MQRGRPPSQTCAWNLLPLLYTPLHPAWFPAVISSSPPAADCLRRRLQYTPGNSIGADGRTDGCALSLLLRCAIHPKHPTPY